MYKIPRISNPLKKDKIRNLFFYSLFERISLNKIKKNFKRYELITI